MRSVLVVRHGHLVYERYWQSLDAGDGHNSFTVDQPLAMTSGLAGDDSSLGGADGISDRGSDLIGAVIVPAVMD